MIEGGSLFEREEGREDEGQRMRNIRYETAEINVLHIEY
jgi:hypothetical protein